MIQNFFESIEDPKRPLLGPNYWYMKKMGMILPKNKTERVAYITVHEIVTIYVFTQYLELFYVYPDADEIFNNLRISMLSIVIIVKTNTFMFWRKSWHELMDYVTATDKEERDDQDPERAEILQAYTKHSRRITYSYWALVLLTIISVISTPLVYLTSETFRKGLREGKKQFPHIFSSWVPFDKYSSPGCWVTVVWHAFMCTYGGATIAAYDVTAIVVMVFFGGKLDLMRQRCKMFFGQSERGITDEEAVKMFRKIHHSYVLLTKYSRLFNSLLSPVMFLYVVMCSLMLCASAFQLTSAGNATQKIFVAEYLVFGVTQLFLYCWHSNDVLFKSNNLSLGTYESKWWAASVKQRKAILLLTGQLNKKIIFTAGPFTNLTISTFLAILKGAYSYYTLLRN